MKSINFIKSIQNEEGNIISSQDSLELEAMRHFQNQYKDHDLDFQVQSEYISHMPELFLGEDNDTLCRLVTKEELVDTMKESAREKSLGPNSWGVEVFIHFADLMIPNLLAATEESRINGFILGAINATFITLIAKRKNPQSFVDFCPMSLCNTVYKLISKVIARRMKSILSKIITEEQFGFIKGRQIHDAIGIGQEVMHTIKSRNLKSCILKEDLTKAYNCVDWEFLKMIMIKVGLSNLIIVWIMGCIKTTNFAVIINGIPSKFFLVHRGLRQGCALSPMSFLMVIDSLNRKVRDEKAVGEILGIRV